MRCENCDKEMNGPSINNLKDIIEESNLETVMGVYKIPIDTKKGQEDIFFDYINSNVYCSRVCLEAGLDG